MSDPIRRREMEQLTRERDLYLRLLELGDQAEVAPFLDEALGLVVDVTSADRGYIELLDPRTDDDPGAWHSAQACSSDEIAGIRARLSRGIIAETLARGQTISTVSARHDSRFDAFDSVQRGEIESVICAPIGQDPSFGVIYLAGPADNFSDADERMAEVVGRCVAPLADRLIVRQRVEAGSDATATWRDRLRLDGVFGRSRALASVLQQVDQVAPLDIPVLLTGDSGTGKSLLAKAIHTNSPRANQPFVELNCATLPESIFESELFGHTAGAFSGASGESPGKVGAAERGTLFLDEISEIPLQSQAKILQFLQSKTYYRLGSTQPTQADVRLIAASNRNVREAVKDGQFREDLLYRLEVLPIRMPNLDERREDIPLLAERCAEDACRRHGFQTIVVSTRGLRSLEATEWPGNVRQLAHVVEAGVIRAQAEMSSKVEQRHLFPEHVDGADDAPPPRTLAEATRRFQRDLLLDTLNEVEWNVSEAARRLDVARSHAYNLIKTFGLKRGDAGGQ